MDRNRMGERKQRKEERMDGREGGEKGRREKESQVLVGVSQL